MVEARRPGGRRAFTLDEVAVGDRPSTPDRGHFRNFPDLHFSRVR